VCVAMTDSPMSPFLASIGKNRHSRTGISPTGPSIRLALFFLYRLPRKLSTANESLQKVIYPASLGAAERDDGAFGGGSRCRVLSPVGHESAALLEQVTTPIRGFHFVANRVCQCLIDYRFGISRLLVRPIHEAASHAVYRDAGA